MNIITKYLLGVLILFILSACNENSIFEEELFEKNVYLISNDENIFPLEFSLEDVSPQSTVSISCSGTLFVDENVRVTLTRDTVLLGKYNYSNFGSDESKYAKEIDKANFVMPSLSGIIEKGNSTSYITLPIYIKQSSLETLSPDSIYFIPLSIKDISTYNININKRNALYRVYVENKFAQMKKTTYYTMKGYQTKESGTVSGISGTKILHPLTRNSVRFFAGNNNFSDKSEDIEKYAIRAIVSSDNSLTLEPYISDGDLLQLEQLKPDVADKSFIYKNIYDDQEHRFLLYYKFRVKTNGVWGEWLTIRESLRKIENEDK